VATAVVTFALRGPRAKSRLNQVYFECQDAAAVDACAGPDPGACDEACDPMDMACHQKCAEQAGNATHDTSRCVKQAGACPSVGGGGGQTCSGSGIGQCTIDADCGSDHHCTNGACFMNMAGSKCTIDADCGSDNHCTNGCCQGNHTGSSCTIDADCGADNHCTNGTCQSNGLGSQCTIDADCGSDHHCTNGKCQMNSLGSECTQDSDCGGGTCDNGKCT
jgi:hypothetical protein